MSSASNGSRSRVVGRDLTCYLCRQHYKNPKLLPCLHTFCQECLEKAHEKDNESFLICPSCQSRFNLSANGGIASLKSNFMVKNMLDLLAVNLNEVINCGNCDDKNRVTVRCAECAEFLCQPCADGHKRVRFTRNHSLMTLKECENQGKIHSTAYCPKHEDGVLKLFCETCQVPMCRDCTIVDHPITVHEYRYVEEAFETCKDALSTLSNQVSAQIPNIVEAVGQLNDISQQLEINKGSVARDIHIYIEQYVSALRQREKELLGEMDKIYSRKRHVLSVQKEKLEQDLSKLKIATEFTNKILIYGSPLEVLGIKKQLSAHLKNLKSKKQRGVPLSPQETDQMEFQLEYQVAQKLTCIPDFGEIVSGSSSNATIVEGDGLKRAIAGKPATFTIKKNPFFIDELDDDDSGIVLKVKSKDADSIGAVDIIEGEHGTYRVTYEPQTPGTVCLAVFLKDDHIHGSPFVVSVHKEIKYNEGSKKYILGLDTDGPGQFVCPYGVAVSPLTGDIWVTDSGNTEDQIQVFSKNNQLKFRFGKVGNQHGEFNDPADITFVGDDRVAVVDRGNHRVQIFNAEGHFQSTFGTKGSGVGQLSFPTGVAASDHAIIAVCDNGNKRVQLFKDDGSHLMTLDESNPNGVKFSSPWNAAVNHQHELIVTDSINHCVLVFGGDGKLVQRFGSHGNGDGEFNTPTGVTIDGENNILVVDRDNNRVQVFTSTGVYIAKINTLGVDGAEFFHPGGICVSPFGAVIVADCLYKCVEVFQF
ncbi:E3 ubiquitin-protein ligase TRIM71-like [Dendronephthya gigantea]|uniref:E3 ubiquitin-protein ligase TRIM71-like n=1 Tax=Dendronephthya gigantea TaxID=151771 RepID=UPI00106D380A|nr:E3 ubiquitin-protein ligase TRIM71-like [Dendronephthya gigantea]XP_028407771.1 E3 ubiquitin-protein ligase TRIM71-like [Dendronephthya gigantea]